MENKYMGILPYNEGEKNIFVGIIDLRIILDYWVGLKVNDRVLIRERQQGIWDPEA